MGSLEAEAKVLEEAVDFAWDVGTRDVHFECDSKLIVDAVFGVSSPQVFIYNKHLGLHRSHMLSKQRIGQLTS